MELFQASGWSQSDLMRLTGMTRGGVNGLVTGPTNPSEATLKLLELLMLKEGKTIPGAEKHPELQEQGQRLEDREILPKLVEIRKISPKHYRIAKTIIDGLHQDIKSDVDSAASNLLKKATKPKL